MIRRALTILLLLVLASASAACGEDPPCEALNRRLCAAMGDICDEAMQAKLPSDPELCERVLADKDALAAQLEATLAMAAATRLSRGAPAAP